MQQRQIVRGLKINADALAHTLIGRARTLEADVRYKIKNEEDAAAWCEELVTIVLLEQLGITDRPTVQLVANVLVPIQPLHSATKVDEARIAQCLRLQLSGLVN